MAKAGRTAKALRRDAQAALAVCGGWHARLTARRICQFLDERMSGSGLTLAQFNLLAQIAAAADDTIGALAERMDLDPSTLSRTLRTLEVLDLVEIAVVETDQRRRTVWLTETGARTLEKALPAWRAAHDELERLLPLDGLRHAAAAAATLPRPETHE